MQRESFSFIYPNILSSFFKEKYVKKSDPSYFFSDGSDFFSLPSYFFLDGSDFLTDGGSLTRKTAKGIFQSLLGEFKKSPW
jgi:hypothetical protein